MKILLVANGRLESPLTWSGVPLRVCEELKLLGHEVCFADMSRPWSVKIPRILFNRIVRHLVPSWRAVMFKATGLGIGLQSRWLRREAARHADVDLIVVFEFSVDVRGIRQPAVLVHDWTNGWLEAMFCRREMTQREIERDLRQCAAMRSAVKVVSLYPLGAEFLRRHVGANVRYYGNPVNVRGIQDMTELIRKGMVSRRVLLIGGVTYRENVICTIRAANRLGDDSLAIDVIGLSDVGVRLKHGTIRYHGYLDRSRPEQLARYNEIMGSARCLVNVRGGWGGGSSVAEAMYCGKPVIVGDYRELQALYGAADGRFGYFCRQMDDSMLAEKLRMILEMDQPAYVRMCETAHATVASDTYTAFVKQLLDLEQ